MTLSGAGVSDLLFVYKLRRDVEMVQNMRRSVSTETSVLSMAHN